MKIIPRIKGRKMEKLVAFKNTERWTKKLS
jgi:hypothetical protein